MDNKDYNLYIQKMTWELAFSLKAVPVRTSTPHSEVLDLSVSHFWIQSQPRAGKASSGSGGLVSAPMWKPWMEFLALDFGLAQS